MYERAIDVIGAALGKGHFRTAMSMGNLATLHCEQGNYELARPLIGPIVDAASSTPPREKLGFAGMLASLARHFLDCRDFDSAESLSKRALEQEEALLGPDHPHVAYNLSCLAMIAHQRRDPDRARPLARRSLKIYRDCYGSSHPETKAAQKLLARIAAKSKRRPGQKLRRRASGRRSPR